MGKSWRIQKNGRERGNPGNGDGAFNEVMPITHAQIHKGKRDMKIREDRKAKERRWEED